MAADADATISASVAASGAASPRAGSSVGSMFSPGSFFASRYRIKRMLGAGGMGAVYEAFDQELGVPIALKVIRTEVIADPDAARDYERRFKQELLLARQVSHPNVVRIHDLGDASGIKYITMSYVEGADLASVLRDGAMPVDRVKRLGIQFLSGLAAAHDVGIAHRDLKPQNLLIDRRDQLYVSDFGLAKSLEPTLAGLTRTGEFLGTPRYISPEQVEGKPADHRGDIYAAGLILYEMVTGDVPFSGPSAMALMLQRVQQRPKSAREKNPDVPEYLDRIIMRCLERDPDARYQNAHEVLADLRGERSSAGTGASSSSRTISWTVAMPSRKGWLIAASIGAIVVIAAATPATRRWVFGDVTTSQAATQAAAPEPVRLAVLPFTIASEAPGVAYAAAGIEEALAAKLFQVKNVNVASASSVQRVERAKTAGDQIGRELGASFLVTGMVQGSEKELRVTVRLEDTSTNQRVWFQEYSGIAADLLTIQDNIFRDLVPNLKLSLTTEEQLATVAHPTENINAYEAYLKGRQAMRNDQDLANVKAAIGFYEEALKKDPRFALAYAGIADAALRMYRETREQDWANRAQAAATQAESLDDSLTEVHLSLGNVYQQIGRTNEAVVHLERAVQQAPNSDDAYRRLGRAYLASGKPKEAIAAYEKAVEINRYHWVNYAQLGVAHAQQANFEESIKAFNRVTELAPDNAAGFNDLGAAYLAAGRAAEAIPAFQQALKLQPISDSYSNLAIAYAQAGKFAEAVPMFAKAVELQPNEEALVGNLADGYRWAGNRDKANQAYDQAIALGLKDLQVNPRDAIAKANLALYYAKKGEEGPARRFIRDARSIDKANVDLIYREAVLCTLLDDMPCAMTNLEAALKKGYTIEMIESDLDLRRLRGDPGYQSLKAKAARAKSSL